MAATQHVSDRINLLWLPIEMLQEVWTYLSNPDLKHVRLMCKGTGETATSALFHNFTLYPHLDSVNHLRELANHTRLGSCVHNIIHDCAYSSILRKMPDERDHYQDDPEARKAIRARLKLFDTKSTDLRSVTCQLDLFLSLQEIFPGLSNLANIIVFCNMPRTDAVPAFYAQRLPLVVIEAATNYIFGAHLRPRNTGHDNLLTMLLATAYLPTPLKRLQLHGKMMDWLTVEALTGSQSRLTPIVGALEELNLTFTDDNMMMDCYHTQRVQLFLKQASSLIKLTLTIGVIERDPDDIEELESMATMQDDTCLPPASFGSRSSRTDNNMYRRQPEQVHLEARLSWSNKLEILELGGLKCSTDELKSVLGHQATHLKILKLRDLMLVSTETSYPPPRLCLVKLIKWMRDHLTLQNVSFGGTLTNLGMQHWVIIDYPNWPQSGLHKQVADYITTGGPCPLDHVQIPPGYYDLGKKTEDFKFPSEFVDPGDHYTGDEGWTMEYIDPGPHWSLRPRDQNSPEVDVLEDHYWDAEPDGMSYGPNYSW